MINIITSSDQHLYATGGNSFPYINHNSNIPMQGMLRINGSEMEVFDGTNWMKIYASTATIGLNNSANSAIDWAIQKMAEEKEWKELAESNQAVKIALDKLEEAQRQLDITVTLAREYEQTTN